MIKLLCANKLNGKLAEQGMTKEGLAKELQISPSTLYRKLNKSGVGFTVGEVEKITKVLSLSSDDVNLIFFSQ